MKVVPEFSPEHVAENSSPEDSIFYDFLNSKEPYESLFKENPWMIPPNVKKPLEWGENYWNTTVARKHPYWKDFELPVPTKDIHVLRSDLKEWGFGLIEEAMSKTQTEAFITRILEQAEGEEIAGIKAMSPTGQYIHTLINKGEIFGKCIEQHPDAVQAGPLIEQLLNETLGPGWICHSFLSNGADPGKYPQGMHMDQGPLVPWITEQAPALVNTMYIPQDIGKRPPAINLEAEAGTIMIFDGRVLHGTGVNKTDKRRFVATMSNVKAWMRTQENWSLSVAPDVIEKASPKLLHRMGMQAIVYGATIEGFGMGASGKVGDVWGNMKPFRTAYDEGKYERVRELSPKSSKEDLSKDYTVGRASKNAYESTKKEKKS